MKKIKELVDEAFEVAKRARVKGLDPTTSPESEEVVDLASLVEVLVGPKGVAQVIRELSKSMPREEVAFKLAEKTVKGEFFQGNPEQLAEQAIRVGLAILTEGVTAAPVQGISMVKIKNGGRDPHLAVYFAGPIRSAGGTDQALTVVLSDFVRQILNLPKYAPTKEAVERFIEEIRLYEQRVTRFQYRFSDENLRYVIERLPVEVTGVKTEEVEVATHRNVPGVETNGIRGGALLVVNDGLIGRAAKVLAITEKMGLPGWEWLKSVVPEKTEEKGIMEEVIAGRPVFSSNKLFGGFRLRYGRSRNTGLACIGVHPVVMKVLKNFLAIGTQVRMDVPSKGGVVAPVDYLEPPIIKLSDGSVVKVTSEKDVPEQFSILFLGDILISFGDFLSSNKTLLPSGYVEEFWSQELKAAFEKNKNEASEKTGLPVERLETLIEKPLTEKPTFQEAVKITTLEVPLHPNFVFYWSNLSVDEAIKLRGWLKTCNVKKDTAHTEISGDATAKVLLEKILVPHTMQEGKVIISGETASALLLNLGFDKEISATQTSIFEHINALAGVVIRDKTGSWLDARMGRPEKAKRREMKPVVHVLFPVGFAGGSRRNLLDAEKKGEALIDLENRRCPQCGTETFLFKCQSCASITESTGRHSQQKVNLKELIRESLAMARVGPLKLVKGVRGLTNKTKTAEPLIKGILRAKYDLSVFRDGTVRFDATNAPLTNFKPIEINLSVEEAKQLGYQTDFRGAPLESPEQVCELDFQDIIIPRKGAEYLVKTAQFLDELLVKYYGEPAFYKLSKIEDLVGCLIVGLAPHTICGVFGRIIGVTESQVCYAHPVWHSAKRRDCDGDEDSILLALDCLINFSKVYLSERIGGIMDAPLMLSSFINLDEVQRQALEVDIAKNYPLEFYQATFLHETPKKFADKIKTIDSLRREKTHAEFTIPTSNINRGNQITLYSRLPSMPEKIAAQFEIMERLACVDVREVALNVLTTHFMKDIIGNMRAFTTQTFRCKSCNRRYRRPPLSGKCLQCNGELAQTVYRGGIEKYLDQAEMLVTKYNLPNYYHQRIQLVKSDLDLLFGKEEEKKSPFKQGTLADFV